MTTRKRSIQNLEQLDGKVEQGEGERRVVVGYLLETPVWKTTYRLVVDKDGLFLQGWALVENMTDDDWSAVIDTNLTGVFHVCRTAAKTLRDGGRIVSMASIAATVGFFGQSNYAAAKAGVAAMTRVLSRELARRRITVNAVAPGVVLTEMGKTIPEHVREGMLAQIPLGRFGEPEDIARVILFLCSPLAAYMTGQTLHVNGGWTS